MREIKFRVWDKNDLEILSWEYCNRNHWDLYTMFEQKTEIYPLMQYTGLKDKNGKEIYEGDILKWDEKEWGAPYIDVVKWDYEQLYFRKFDWRNFCEVIGNIYENPELIK